MTRTRHPQPAAYRTSALLTLLLCACATGQDVARPAGWVITGGGRAIDGNAGFIQEGKEDLVVANPGLGAKSYLLSGDIVLPAPGAAIEVHFSDRTLVRGQKDVDALTPMPRVARGKDGKVRVARKELVVPDSAAASIPLQMIVEARTIEIYLADHAEIKDRKPGQAAPAHLLLSGGAKIENLKVTAMPETSLLPLIGNARVANASSAKVGNLATLSQMRGSNVLNGVPFYFAENEKDAMDVSTSMSGLKSPFGNLNFYLDKSTTAYGRSVLTAPSDQYSAIHLVAFSAGRADHAQRMTVRIGYYGTKVGILEDAVVQVPLLTERRADGDTIPIPVTLADGRQGFVHQIRVPLPQTANVKEFRKFRVEFTRDMNTHINPPDPSSYGKIPVGIPSDVVVLAATLEPSPVTMTHSSEEPGNVFFDTQKAAFKLTLNNRSATVAEVQAYAVAQGPGTGEELGIEPRQWGVQSDVTLQPGESREVELDVTPEKRGWYSCQLGIRSGNRVLQQRDTTFAVLAPDTRKAADDSPFGIWEFWFPHSSVPRDNQVEMLASLIHKGGWRWTYGGKPIEKTEDADVVYPALRDKYKITWSANNLPDSYQSGEGSFDPEEFQKVMPPAIARGMKLFDPYFKVLHESRSSTALVRRYSEYLGGAPYDMPAAELAKLEKQIENVKKYTMGVKAIEPKAKIVLFNDYPSVVDQYLKRGFPKEAFDVIGVEGAMFLREPERQPDWLSLLGNMHQLKRSMAKYGYDKPIWTTEALYHPTEAGGLSLHEQGVIAVREAMMALQLGVARMVAAGLIKDPSDDYRWSNWGSAGYCFRDPEINPKPSYAMYAWLTQVLDQGKAAGYLAVPNASLHAVDFVKPDGSHVYAVWVAKGVQAVTLEVAGKPAVYDVFGNPLPSGDAASLSFNASPTPIYITGTTVRRVISAEPVEQKAPIGKLLVDFDKPNAMKYLDARNAVLDAAWETPRLKGSFDTAFVVEDGATALKVTLKPDEDPRKLLPRYAEYQLAEPIALDRSAGDFALRIKGNSAWGRIMFEVVDARGRIWTSCGNQAAGASNAADSRGESFISFEGWHTIRFPVVGMYPGKDQTSGRPYNYNWWPINAPEEAEMAAREEANKTQHAERMKAHAAALVAHGQAMQEWQTQADAAKAAGKKATEPPKKPAVPAFRSIRYVGVAAVDYPIKLTKVIVDMRPSILYLNEEKPVPTPTIFIDNLGVIDAPPGQ